MGYLCRCWLKSEKYSTLGRMPTVFQIIMSYPLTVKAEKVFCLSENTFNGSLLTETKCSKLIEGTVLFCLSFIFSRDVNIYQVSEGMFNLLKFMMQLLSSLKKL